MYRQPITRIPILQAKMDLWREWRRNFLNAAIAKVAYWCGSMIKRLLSGQPRKMLPRSHVPLAKRGGD
jgi:hypothetical protein